MKIAMFGHKRIPSREGGVEIVVEELASRMAVLGHSVTCYNRGCRRTDGSEFSPDMPEQLQGVRLKTVPTLDKKGLAAVTSSLFAACAAAFSTASVVHIHAEGPAFMCWLPKLLGKRVIVTVHGLDWQREKWKHGFGARYIRAGEKMAVRFADEIIVLSRHVQTYFRSAYGRETIWIPNGITEPTLREPREIRERFGLEKDGYILFLGRLVPEKGIHYLLQAWRELKTEEKLVIAGGSSDTDSYVQQLHAMAAGDDRILFTGFVQGQLLEELYSNAWVYVLPSDLEGMPLSLLEAMSYGNCCLVSDIPECTEVMEEQGLVFSAGNVSSLRECLELLCRDRELVLRKKQTAAEFICSKYNWDEVVSKTLELY